MRTKSPSWISTLEEREPCELPCVQAWRRHISHGNGTLCKTYFMPLTKVPIEDPCPLRLPEILPLFYKLGVLSVGVLMVLALLFGVYIAGALTCPNNMLEPASAAGSFSGAAIGSASRAVPCLTTPSSRPKACRLAGLELNIDPQWPQYPNTGILIMVLGRYIMVGYLDPWRSGMQD